MVGKLWLINQIRSSEQADGWLWIGDGFVNCSNQELSSRLPSNLLVKYAALAFGNDRSQTKPSASGEEARRGLAWPWVRRPSTSSAAATCAVTESEAKSLSDSNVLHGTKSLRALDRGGTCLENSLDR